MGRSALQRELAQKTGISLFAGCLVWLLLLEPGATAVRRHTGEIGYDVVFGPLVLNHIHKQKTGDDFLVSISFENSLLWYLLFWIIAGLLLGIGVARLRRGKAKRASTSQVE